MLKRIKSVFMSLSLLGALTAPVLLPAIAHADIEGGLNCGAELSVSGVTNGDPNCASGASDPGTKLDSVVKLVINIFSLVVGIIAVIMIIIGGLKYITSSGDSGNVTSAKNTILYAIIGLVVVALAQLIVRFVLQKVSQ